MFAFSIWHLLVLLFLVAIFAVVVGVVVWAILRSQRKPPPRLDEGLVAQVAALDRLHREGAIDADEHARRRAVLLSGR